jgi:hypothetical protein
MNVFLLIADLAVWEAVLHLGFLLVGALRALALLRWRVAQLAATTPSRLARSGLRPGKTALDFTLPALSGTEVGCATTPTTGCSWSSCNWAADRGITSCRN